jgi:hypothetical protein
MMTKAKLPTLNHINRSVKTPREENATIAERIERARQARRHAEMAMLGSPKIDPKPEKQREGYFGDHYVGLTWRGKRIVIPKNKFGW